MALAASHIRASYVATATSFAEKHRRREMECVQHAHGSGEGPQRPRENRPGKVLRVSFWGDHADHRCHTNAATRMDHG